MKSSCLENTSSVHNWILQISCSFLFGNLNKTLTWSFVRRRMRFWFKFRFKEFFLFDQWLNRISFMLLFLYYMTMFYQKKKISCYLPLIQSMEERTKKNIKWNTEIYYSIFSSISELQKIFEYQKDVRIKSTPKFLPYLQSILYEKFWLHFDSSDWNQKKKASKCLFANVILFILHVEQLHIFASFFHIFWEITSESLLIFVLISFMLASSLLLSFFVVLSLRISFEIAKKIFPNVLNIIRECIDISNWKYVKL